MKKIPGRSIELLAALASAIEPRPLSSFAAAAATMRLQTPAARRLAAHIEQEGQVRMPRTDWPPLPA